jgi:TolB protein
MRIGRIAWVIAALGACGASLLLTSRPAQSAPAASGKIAFQSDRAGNFDIVVTDPSGRQQVNVTAASRADEVAPAWSADGTQIAFTTNRAGRWQVWLMLADGTGQRPLPGTTGDDVKPAWSPDGRRVAFESNRDGNWEIYVSDVEGGTPVNLSKSPSTDDIDPSWSPDGTKLVYASGQYGKGGFRLVILDVETGEKRVLPPFTTDAFRPAWSPDGRRIAFTGFRAGNYDIFLTDPFGKLRTRVTSDSAEDADPSWSPDGRLLAFTSYRDTNYELYVTTLDGKSQRNLSRTPAATDDNPAWQVVTVHGRRRLAAVPRPEGALTRAACAPATYTGTNASNTLTSGGCGDTLDGRGGADLLYGNGGGDSLWGDRYLDGSQNRDRLYGGDGNDHLYARDGLVDYAVDGQAGADCHRADASDPIKSAANVC